MRLKGKMHQIPHRELEMRPLCYLCIVFIFSALGSVFLDES
jgi:hypothetical protein